MEVGGDVPSRWDQQDFLTCWIQDENEEPLYSQTPKGTQNPRLSVGAGIETPLYPLSLLQSRKTHP